MVNYISYRREHLVEWELKKKRALMEEELNTESWLTHTLSDSIPCQISD